MYAISSLPKVGCPSCLLHSLFLSPPSKCLLERVCKADSPVAVSDYTVRAHPLIPPHDFISLSLKYKEES